MAKVAAVSLVIETKDTAKRLAEIDFELDSIGKKLREAKKAGRSDVYAGLKQQQAALRTEAREVNKALRDQSLAFLQAAKNIPKDSLAGLTTQYRELRRQIDLLSEAERKSAFGQSLLKSAGGIKRQIDTVSASVGDFRSQVGNYKNSVIDALNSTGLLGGNVSAIFSGAGTAGAIGAGLGLAAVGVKKLFDLNKEISSLQAGVQKTTQLTEEQVNSLTESLIELDTVTTIEDLLKIAEIAGRLGVQGEKGVLQFTKAIEKLSIALGDEFTGGAGQITDEVGRLSNVFFGATQDGEVLADRVLSIGNALNVLAANGASTAPVITDFSTRIGGLGVPLGVTAGEILGISATLQELNVSAERGGTAVGRIFQELTQAPEAFAKELGITKKTLQDAGFQVNSFTDLVNTDLVGALQFAGTRILELNGNNTELADTLKELKINGSGELEVLLKLAQGNERLSQNINLANRSLLSQDSLTAEVATRQENLAGVTARLGNTLREFFVSSGAEKFFTTIISGISSVIASFSGLFDGLGGVSTAAKTATAAFDEQAQKVASLENELTPLLSRYDELSKKSNLTKVEQEELARIITRVGEITPGAVTSIDAYGRALTINAGASREFLEAERARLLFTNKEAIKATENEIKALQRRAKVLKNESETQRGARDSPFARPLTDKELAETRQNLNNITTQLLGAQTELKRLRGEPPSASEKKASEDRVKIEQDAAAKRLESEKKLAAERERLNRLANGKIKEELGVISKEIDKVAANSIAGLEKRISDLRQRAKEAPNSTLFVQLTNEANALQVELDDTRILYEKLVAAQSGISAVANVFSADPLSSTLPTTLSFSSEDDLNKNREDQQELSDIQIEANAARLADTEATLAQTRAAYLGFYDGIGSSLATFTENTLNGQEGALKDFSKSIISTALEALELLVQIQLAQAFGYALTSAESLATFGVAGLAKFAIISSIVKGFFAVVKAGASNFDQGGQIPKITGSRVTDPQNIPTQPGGDNVLAMVRRGEVVLNDGQQRRLFQYAGPDVFRRIGVPGFETGGLVGGTPQILNPNVSVSIPGASQSGVDEATFQKFALLIGREVAAQVGPAVEAGFMSAEEKTDRRRQLRNDTTI